jgi:hypothetical protein
MSLLCKLILQLLLRQGGALGLIAGNAMETPGEQGYPLGQDRLQVSLRLEAFQHAEPCASQSATFSMPGTTGAGERMPAQALSVRHCLIVFLESTRSIAKI